VFVVLAREELLDWSTQFGVPIQAVAHSFEKNNPLPHFNFCVVVYNTKCTEAKFFPVTGDHLIDFGVLFQGSIIIIEGGDGDGRIVARRIRVIPTFSPLFSSFPTDGGNM
jgi:hypothetical protein